MTKYTIFNFPKVYMKQNFNWFDLSEVELIRWYWFIYHLEYGRFSTFIKSTPQNLKRKLRHIFILTKTKIRMGPASKDLMLGGFSSLYLR